MDLQAAPKQFQKSLQNEEKSLSPEPKAKEIDSFLDQSILSILRKEKYLTINTNMLNTVYVASNKSFSFLKDELETFNQQVEKAMIENTVISNYSWKHSLYVTLRNFLVEAASTEDKNLRGGFISKIKTWYTDKVDKKLGNPDTSIISRTEDTTRDQSNFARMSPIKALDQDQSFLNSSLIQADFESLGQKSFLAEGNSGNNEFIPSRYRAEVLKDYEEGRRSLHGTTDPPYERILHFGRKTPKGILKPISKIKIKKTSKIPKSLDLGKEKSASIHKDEAILSNLSSARIVEIQSQQEVDKSEKGGNSSRDGEDDDNYKDNDNDNERDPEDKDPDLEADLDIEPGEKKISMMAPTRKLFINDKRIRKDHRIRGHLMPMELRSGNSNYMVGTEPHELSLEKRWRDYMNKKLIEKREKSEFVGYMKQWAFAKANFEEERNRKGEAYNFGSSFEKRAFHRRANSMDPRLSEKESLHDTTLDLSNAKEDIENAKMPNKTPFKGQNNDPIIPAPLNDVVVYREIGNKSVVSPQVIDLTTVQHRRFKSGFDSSSLGLGVTEADISLRKVEQIKKLHESLLFGSRGVSSDNVEDESYSLNRPISLSVYDQRKMSNHTPFSSIFKKNNSEGLADKQIREVHDLKKKLANLKMKVSIKALENSLILPSLNNKNLDNTLPAPGRGLILNPFDKGKERKGRGKKRK